MGFIQSIMHLVKGSGGSPTQGGVGRHGMPAAAAAPANRIKAVERDDEAGLDEEIDLDAVISDHGATDQLRETLLKRFREKSKMSSDEWEAIEDRVVIIHEKMSAEDAIQELTIWVRDEKLPDVAAFGPLDGFARANAAMNKEHRFKKVASMSEPVKADVYVTP